MQWEIQEIISINLVWYLGMQQWTIRKLEVTLHRGHLVSPTSATLKTVNLRENSMAKSTWGSRTSLGNIRNDLFMKCVPLYAAGKMIQSLRETEQLSSLGLESALWLEFQRMRVCPSALPVESFGFVRLPQRLAGFGGLSQVSQIWKRLMYKWEWKCNSHWNQVSLLVQDTCVLVTHVRLFATPLSVHRILQARILEWVAFPSPGDLPDQGIEPRFSTLQTDSLPSELTLSALHF